MPPANIGQDFLDHVPISGVVYEHNDLVCILSGENSGKFGSLVTVLSLEPEPKFLLELESGFDVEAFQSELARVNS